MARVKLKNPAEFLFKTKIPVRITDLNYGLHVGNDTVLSIAHEARLQFLKYYGFDEGKIVHNNIGLIMADAVIQYKNEIFYGVNLEVNITPIDFTTTGFDLFYLFADADSGREYVRMKTAMVCFNYDLHKAVKRPIELNEIWKTN